MTDLVHLTASDIRAAATRVDADATTLSRVQPARALDAVAKAMPGAASIAVADTTASTLKAGLDAGVRQVEGHADALRTSATTFKATDVVQKCEIQHAAASSHAAGTPAVAPFADFAFRPLDLGPRLSMGAPGPHVNAGLR